MNDLQKGIVTLIRSAVTGETLPLPDGFDIEQAYPQLVRHQITALAYEGAVRCGIPKTSPTMQALFKRYCQDLLRSEAQMKAVEKLCTAFEQQGIDYMPMKGCNMKTIYPRPELRKMGDADILIRDAQYPAVKSIVQAQGFEEKVGADHTYTWRSDALYLELHKRPIPKEPKDHYLYFGDGWSRARLQSGTRYALSPEDEYIYIFAHFAKHYRFGGIGCRQITDLWVYRRAHPDMDMTYIEAETEKLRLKEFYKNTLRTLSAWFEDGAQDEKTIMITDFIFSSGSWGTRDSSVLSRSVRYKTEKSVIKNVKGHSVLRLLFPTALSMEGRYRVLVKHRWLLPVFWIVRWVDVLINRRKNIRTRMQEMDLVTDENISEYEKSMRAVGIEYHED